MMRFIRIFAVGFCLGLGSAAHALDYSDHTAVCLAIETNRTHAWLAGEREKFSGVCQCQLAELQKVFEPEKFEWVQAWMVDAKAFAKNLPEGVNPTEFMSEVIPASMKVGQVCK